MTQTQTILAQADRHLTETPPHSGAWNALHTICTILASTNSTQRARERIAEQIALSQSLSTPTPEHVLYAREEQRILQQYFTSLG